MAKVYITKTSNFLPNAVIPNDEMEEFLGLINGNKSRSKAMVLRSNKIMQRYYALTKEGKITHTNADLTALAVKSLFSDNPAQIKEVDLLCCGTSSPDQMMPAHGVMVHGKLPEMNSIEVMSPAGNCCSGVQGMKYAFLNIASGQTKNAVCSASERLSPTMRAEKFEEEVKEVSEGSNHTENLFDLNEVSNSITKDLPLGLLITYYETYDDALLEINALDTSYSNNTPNSQTIYGRVENDNDCYGISLVELIVNPLPKMDAEQTLFYCLNKYPETIATMVSPIA